MGHIHQKVRLRAGKSATVRMLVDTDGREAAATILVGKVAEPILGVEALEALGLTVDSRRRRLVPSRPYAVRLGGYR